MKKKPSGTIILLLLISSYIYSQDSAPVVSVKGTNEYIEYIQGNMPLVISIPHDGYLKPDSIPERSCINCAKNRDIFTIEIGTSISNFIFQKTGFYPYLIINHLHRTRLDPNRNIEEAASGNKQSETAWAEFHNFIDCAVKDVQDKYGKGLYIDLHGHRHNIRRIELGYMVSAEELRLDDDFLNDESFYEYSSIRHLIEDNINSYSYSELLRGPYSFGTLLEESGYVTVPSINHPYPEEGEPHFSGGFNTGRHSSAAGGTVDGIQIELDLDLRLDPGRRKKFAEDVSDIILKYLKIHYFNNLDRFPLIVNK